MAAMPKIEGLVGVLIKSAEIAAAAAEFKAAVLEPAFKDFAAGAGLKPGPYFGAVRIAVTGKKVSPPLFESMEALGREETEKRLRETADLVA